MADKILVTQHWSPYDGAFWEWNFTFIGKDENRQRVIQHIYNEYDRSKPGYHVLGMDVIRKLVKGRGEVYPYEFVEMLRVDDPKLWDKIPTNLIPRFYRFFADRREEFEWRCDGQELYDREVDDWVRVSEAHMTMGEPLEMSGYRGNGGIGIEVSGWVCEECVEMYGSAED